MKRIDIIPEIIKFVQTYGIEHIRKSNDPCYDFWSYHCEGEITNLQYNKCDHCPFNVNVPQSQFNEVLDELVIIEKLDDLTQGAGSDRPTLGRRGHRLTGSWIAFLLTGRP